MTKVKVIILALIVALLAGCGDNTVILPTTNVPATLLSPTAILPSPTAVPTIFPDNSPTPEPTVAPTATERPLPLEISIMAVGDIMCHKELIEGAKTGKRAYDFTYEFQYIKNVIGCADLALGNFECTCGGPDKPYSVNKTFSAPDTIIDAIKRAGFDVLSTANNHAYDTGSEGMHRTIDIIRGSALLNVGTRKDASEKPFIIVDANGIKIGIAAYTYETDASKKAVSLNGKPVKTKDIGLVSVFYPKVAADLKKMLQTAQDMRAAGAELVVFFLHWGTEYKSTPNTQQKEMARGLADAGVDVIFGSHPHYLQPIGFIDSKQSGKRTTVVYSMGNFIANKCTTDYTDDGMIVRVKVSKDPESGRVGVSSVEYLPTWKFMYKFKGIWKYTVVPLPQALADPEAFGIISKKDMGKAQTSYDHTQKLLGDAVSEGWLTMFSGTGN